MPTIAADRQSLSKANSRTTRAWTGFDSANTWRGNYLIPKGWKIRVTDPDATAVVVQPFVVEVKHTGEDYLASGISNAYELGRTPGQAVKNYLEILVDGLIWLEKHEAELSPSVHEDLQLLQRYLQIA